MNMNTIRAIVRDGQLEVESLVDLPDGTELVIPLPEAETIGMKEEDQLDTPEAIQKWVEWLNSLEPWEFTAEEQAAWEAARKEDKELELASWEEPSERLENLFP